VAATARPDTSVATVRAVEVVIVRGEEAVALTAED
jgi:hypothetical protein